MEGRPRARSIGTLRGRPLLISGSVTPGPHRHYPSTCLAGDSAGSLPQERGLSSPLPHLSLPHAVQTHSLCPPLTRNPGSASLALLRSALFLPERSQRC